MCIRDRVEVEDVFIGRRHLVQQIIAEPVDMEQKIGCHEPGLCFLKRSVSVELLYQVQKSAVELLGCNKIRPEVIMTVFPGILIAIGKI